MELSEDEVTTQLLTSGTSGESESDTESGSAVTLIDVDDIEELGEGDMADSTEEDEGARLCGDICCMNEGCRALLASGGDPETISMILYMKQV